MYRALFQQHPSHSLTKCAFVAFSLLSSSQPAACWAFASSSQSSSRLFSSSTSSCATMQVAQFPCLSDNYGYLLHDPSTGATAAIDTPDAASYQAELARRGWTLTHILNTHHHWDHTGGNKELKKMGSVVVVGPANEQTKIPGIDEAVKEGDTVKVGSFSAQVIDVGGHTKGHIAYYFADQRKVFVGDSLFALGCGRMFEGTPEQFWTSLKKLRDLPDDTEVYCAHEYTLSNAKFAVSVEPGNAALMKRFASIQAARERGEPTVPSTMGEEKATNPFLRCDLSEEIRAKVGVVAGDSDADAFGKVRRAKDRF